MSLQQDEPLPTHPERLSARRRRQRGGALSLWARAEPFVWLNGAGLVLCLAMVVGLLLLVLFRGMTTFWPLPLVQVKTTDGATLVGEITRTDCYDLTYGSANMLAGKSAVAAKRLLDSQLRQSLHDAVRRGSLPSQLAELWVPIQRLLQAKRLSHEVLNELSPSDQRVLRATVPVQSERRKSALVSSLAARIKLLVEADQTGGRLSAEWKAWRKGEQQWLELGNLAAMTDALDDDSPLWMQLFGDQALTVWSFDIRLPVHRRLVRIGNFELTNEHFRWVSDFELANKGETHPEWGLLLERTAWGRFYGFPSQFRIDDKVVASTPDSVWREYQRHHETIRRRWRATRRLEKRTVGNINRALEQARLALKKVKMRFGNDSPQWKQAAERYDRTQRELGTRFARVGDKIKRSNKENARYHIVLRTSDGVESSIALIDIVRAYAPNRLGLSERFGIYADRWWEFLSGEPREANTEGGVFPAIWGTVVMTLLMSLVVVPFGVLAALYLREYAKPGLLVSIVRISVNNLAGVPSIVFGVFGLGFFCYIVGASIDQLLFATRLPSPTFGTGGLMWASLTLALLTLPVVIVSTEEALAAVPRSMREGSLACGATKWQTIRRIVLPRALPGIMTGMILAMARGAGEVAPLMLVGAVKLAPELPVDQVFPYVHLQRSFMHMGFHVFDLGFQSQNSEAAKPMVFTTTLLLIVLIGVMNLLAIWLRAHLRKRFEFGKF